MDAIAFEHLVADGRTLAAGGDQARSVAALRRALGLWRGPALADTGDAPFAAGPVARLEELRLAATEDRIEADLALGRGAELVPEAEELVAAHPLRERLRGQLMRALYAAGRQADALAVYENTRQILAGQLGVDPSPALSAVHLAILRGELETASPAAAPGTGDAERLPPSAARVGPGPGRTTNLPAQLTSFVGREDELELLGGLLEEGRGYAGEGLAGNWAEMMLMPLGKARAGLGDLDGGRSDLERGVHSAGRIGAHDDEVSGYLSLSDLARRDGDLAQARRLLERALEVAESRARQPIMGPVTARTFGKLGCLAEQEGDLAAAALWHARAIEAAAATEAAFLPNNPLLAEVTEGVAALAAARREYPRAAELLGLAHALQGFRNATSLEVTRATAAAAAAIGDEAYAAAYARGQGLTRDDALALVP